MVFGSFDGLHQGHLAYFQQARAYGNYLIAVVARDEKIIEQKKHAPRFNVHERVRAVKASGLVDEVIVGNERIYDVLEAHRPSVACLGYDQKADITFLQTNFPHITFVRLKPYKPNVYKSSLLNSNV